MIAFGRSASLFLLVLVMFGSGVVSAQSTERSVVGSWKLLSYVDTSPNGTKRFPWGTAPSGLLMYDRSGNMAVQVQRTPVIKLKAKYEQDLRTKDSAALSGAYTAYFGKYVVDWDKMTITHHVEGNLFPFYIGTDQVKQFEMNRDTLTLKVSWTEHGKTWSGIRVFSRLSE